MLEDIRLHCNIIATNYILFISIDEPTFNYISINYLFETLNQLFCNNVFNKCYTLYYLCFEGLNVFFYYPKHFIIPVGETSVFAGKNCHSSMF